ncbi:flagellar biosynthesis protein FlhB [Methylobrevis albus]|uniref:Flagellar biosynthetic protein FlhB n=1 Tax=Methylobrevis albus TaxID=2793297 RepID=A0A931I0T1_9HYPH|nr:flagellar biosynthesis protein FlhB [Methylobrevis albus]MBH0236886.1 flagellar biosynthesis protein FlhB [Methylobrevis albus]
MAEGQDDSEKTEEPTHRRLEQAHEKGDVAKSQEVVAFFTMAAVTAIIALSAGRISSTLFTPLGGIIEQAGILSLDGGVLRRLWLEIGIDLILALGLPLAMMVIAGAAGHMVQHRPVFSAESLKPKFSKVSPLAGVKRLFSPEALVNFAKGLTKLTLVASVMLLVLWPQRRLLDGMVTTDVAAILGITQALSVQMLIAVMAVLALIAGLDFLWQKQRWMKRQRMSLKEIKDEFKQQEGDPHIKAKIRQIRMERSRRRMMAAVPKASVIITNPTHYAVALMYEAGMQAPVCVAKGVDAVALKIREVGRDNDVPIVENPPLARALYAAVDLDATIPEEHYRAVAEVIGFVMSLKGKRRN